MTLALALAVAVFSAGESRSQPAAAGVSPVDQHELHYGAHLPRDRDASRAFDVSVRLVEEGRYSEAVPLILQILDRSEDAFGPAESESPRSLRQRAKDLLAGLPQAGRRAYRLESSAKADRDIAGAIGAGDMRGVAELARRRPYSVAATKSLWFQAARWVDQGEYELAIAVYRRLGDSPAAADLQPQLALNLAAALTASGDRAAAGATLEALSRTAAASQSLPGIGDLSNPAAVGQQLEKLVSAGPSARQVARRSWRRAGGDRRGNPVREGGQPHLWTQWTALSVVDPRHETRLAETANWLRSRERPLAPAQRAVAVDDLVVMRTASNLVALDWLTGRRVWETREEHISEAGYSVDRWMQLADDQPEMILFSPETLRVWFDAVSGGLSTDGQRVFAVESVNHQTPDAHQFAPFGGFTMRLRRAANRLAAYDLATEGKLAWRIGEGPGHGLSGAFFLSTPQSVGDRLFALAELDQTICLVELNPADGELLWRQSLVSVERGVEQDTRRQMIGAATAVSDSQIICSTGVGVVVAVDLLDRAIAWVDRFPAVEGQRVEENLPWRTRSRDAWPRNAEQSWLENRVVISGDRVFVASTESPMLHCLDRQTGKPLWRSERSGESHLAAVAGAVVITVGPKEIVARDLKTGEESWKRPLPEEATLSGHCVVLSDELLVPLSNGSMMVVNSATGETAREMRCWTGRGAGNLLVHRDAILSLTETSLDRYDQSQALLANAERALQSDPQDSAAHCVLGESRLSEGELNPAIDHFLTAYSASPASPLVRSRLRDAVEMRIADEGASAVDLRLLGELAESPRQKIAFLVRGVEFAVGRGELMEAVALTLELIELPGAEETLMMHGGGHYATASRRASQLVSDAWDVAEEVDRQDAATALADRWAALPTIARRRAFVQLFGTLPCCRDALTELIADFEGAGLTLESQFYAAAWKSRADGASPAGGRRRRAEPSPIEPRWATQQVVAEIVRREPAGRSRPRGRRVDSSGGWRRVTLLDVASSPGEPIAADEITDVAIHVEQGVLATTNRAGETVYQTDLSEQSASFIERVKSGDQVGVWRFGPCLFVGGTEEVTALETLDSVQSTDRRLWSSEGLLYEVAAAERETGGWRVHDAEAINPQADEQNATRIMGVGEDGVVIALGSALACLDPLTGRLQWIRRDKAFRQWAAVDGLFVYAVERDGRAARFSMKDGSEDGEWQLPDGRWLLVKDGRIAVQREQGRDRFVEVIEVASGEKLLSVPCSRGVRVSLLDDWGVVVLDVDGDLTLVDASRGVAAMEAQLPVDGTVASVDAVERGGRLVVLVGYEGMGSGSSQRMIPLDGGPAVSGQVFCVDQKTGDLAWPRPISVRSQGLLARQPRDAPLLVFGARVGERMGNRFQTKTQLLVVDLLTGRPIYRNTDLEEDSFAAYQVRYPEGDPRRLEIAFPSVRLALTTTDALSPPRPPASDVVENPVGRPGVGSIVRQSLQAIGGEGGGKDGR